MPWHFAQAFVPHKAGLAGTKAWEKCHGIPSHQLLNVASHMPSSNEQSSAIRRPWYLTVVAAVLLLWGAGMSCYFLPGTVKALLSGVAPLGIDRKSTRLNSSHVRISYAGFCLKKKI